MTTSFAADPELHLRGDMKTVIAGNQPDRPFGALVIDPYFAEILGAGGESFENPAAADAVATGEALTRRPMRFVPVRSVENQAMLMRHKIREPLIGQRTQFFNALRGHLSEIGIIAPQGPNNARALAWVVIEENETVPTIVRLALMPLLRQLVELDNKRCFQAKSVRAVGVA